MSTIEELKCIARKVLEVLAAPTDSKIAAAFDSHVVIHEHGPETTALPFLGRDFTGFGGVKAYSHALSETLDMIRMEWVELVAEQTSSGMGGVVFAKGLGTFAVRQTGKHWNETYVNRVEVNEEGKIVRYDVFAVRSRLSFRIC